MKTSPRRLVPALVGTAAVAVALALTLPASSAESRPIRPGGLQKPAPHVMSFAQGGTPRQLPQRSAGVPFSVTGDGCDHSYGSINECVPVSFPAEVPDSAAARCGWLLAHGYHSLTVNGEDDLGLDSNGDRIACGPGDDGVPG